MADEKSREHNQQNEQERGKAMGAGASTGYQGQGQTNPELNSQSSEMAGQGGGIQGSGQRQSNPGGFSEDRERDESRRNEGSTERRKEPRDE